MSSSMMAGERRWASARRGGMTVLGKVSVPKPLNLPSQRLENHGLDPNVEIVPKGSLSWGSRSSSIASNPWGSSALSPNAEGPTGSPSHLSARPSSSGSGTRPSTAGSDRMHEPASSARVSNSGPSSASGVVTSNQLSLTRPRSADTRPGSSQLSRFAEPISNISMPWGPHGTVEKLVVDHKNDSFSLASGDFPTLGSEKDNSGKKMEAQDHASEVRPGSASGRIPLAKEKMPTAQADVKSGAVSPWRRESALHVEDDAHSTAEMRQGDPQQYLHHNVPSHYDVWRGPPMNAPAGVWFRGPSPGGPPYPPGGPPYPPVPHSAFPIEPLPYYRHQMAPALSNSHSVPQPITAPRGHNLKNGEFYRPQTHDAFMRPGMPIRPGFYPVPMPYDSYYGPPPMGYNPKEHDVPYVGMQGGPQVYNTYSAQNPSEPNDVHARGVGHGSINKALGSEHTESSIPGDFTQSAYKLIMKQQKGGGDAEEEQKNWEPTGASTRTSLVKNEMEEENRREAENRWDREMYLRRPVRNSSYRSQGDHAHSSGPVAPESRGKLEAGADCWGKKSEITAPSFKELPQQLPPFVKDSTLIQKIEGLNAKARASDGRENLVRSTVEKEQNNRLQVINPKVDNSANEVDGVHVPGDFIPSFHEVGSVPSSSRRAHHGVQGKEGHPSQGRFNNQDADGWHRKPPPLVSGMSPVVSTANIGQTTKFHAHDHQISVDSAEKSEAKNEGESFAPAFDPSDGKAKHAKMRELAKQRAVQLQKEEEERIRDQKAKAFAKLEELNRHTLAGDGLVQKVDKSPPTDPPTAAADSAISVEISVADSGSQVNAQISDRACDPSKDSHADIPEKGLSESVVTEVDNETTGAEGSKAVLIANDVSLHMQQQTSQRLKQSIQFGMISFDKSTPINTNEALKDHVDVEVQHDNASTNVMPVEMGLNSEPNLPNDSKKIPEALENQRRKNNRNSKNKHRLDNSSLHSSQMPGSKEAYPSETSEERHTLKASCLDSEAKSVCESKSTIHPHPILGGNSALPNEEPHSRVNHQWKPQNSRRMPKNPQANRSLDKFHPNESVVWAPVRSQSRTEPGEEASQKLLNDFVPPMAKSNVLGQSGIKNKRAEMERYVPKAKELAQHGSVQQASTSSFMEQATPDQTSEVIVSVGSTSESGNGDDNNNYNKQTKPSKAQGTWRQHGSMEMRHSQGFEKGNSNVQKPMEQQELNANPLPDETKVSYDWDPSDGWNMPEPPTTVPPPPPVAYAAKDQRGLAGKGKKKTYKSQKSAIITQDLDQKNADVVEGDKIHSHSSDLELNQTNRPVASKETRAAHWQPKSQSFSAKDAVNSASQQNIGSDEIHTPQLQNDPVLADNRGDVGEAPSAGHQEGKRDKRFSSSYKGQYDSPNQDFGHTEENRGLQLQISSGYRNNRFGRRNESQGDWSYGAQDARQQQNVPRNRERQRQNMHYEYHAVGSNSHSSSSYSNFEETVDGSQNTSSRYRERGPSQSRRGGGKSYGRLSGSREEASYG